MRFDESFEGERPGGAWSAERSASAAIREAHDPLHAYAIQLDRLIARAPTMGYQAALHQAETLYRPRPEEAAELILERKRRELKESLGLWRQAHFHLPGAEPARVGPALLETAEMTGASGLSMQTDLWSAEPWRVWPLDTPPEALQQALAEAGPALTALSHVAPDGRAEAIYDVDHETLSLGAAPFAFEQSLRAIDAATGQLPLDVSLSYDRAREVLEGGSVIVRLTLKNMSSDCLVLESLRTDGPYDQPETFSRASLGALRYDAFRDRYVYGSAEAGAAPKPFHTAALRPGATHTVQLALKFLESGTVWREFSLKYRRLPLDRFMALAYVPVPLDNGQFPPEVAYQPMRDLPRPEAVDWGTFLLRQPERLTLHGLGAAWAFPVGQRPFPLAKARSLAPQAGEAVHYSRWQQGWILRLGEKGTALVTPQRVTEYPQVSPECFVLVDESEQRVPLRFAEGQVSRFRPLALGINDWESHAMGLSVSLPKYKLGTFFAELARLRCRTEVTQNLLGSQSLWITPEAEA